MKRVLITGENSYIGTNVEKWLLQSERKHSVDTISVRGEEWKKVDFSQYDVVFHVAAIVHVPQNPKSKSLYYNINSDLAFETAKKAKNDGVRQFIFMSTLSIYSKKSIVKGKITLDAKPIPDNHYGRSKLEAEKKIKTLENENFKVVILRPPMIYGKGCKGNYPRLAKMAKTLPFFPKIVNQRSMLHIDNFCAFVELMIKNEESGVFFPQNQEYVCTSDMVRLIAEVNGEKIKFVKIFNWMIKITRNFIVQVNKAFGDLVIEKSMSYYHEPYQVRDFYESIRLTEYKGLS